MSRTKIEEVTLDALRTRQSLVKGERLVRHEMRAVLIQVAEGHQPRLNRKPNSGLRMWPTEEVCTFHRKLQTSWHDIRFRHCSPEGFATLSSSAMPEATSELGRSKLR